MPANLGYISAMLFNQNNCASEVSTVTSKFEIEVGKDLCVMLGYDRDKCMGHLTAGGTVANIEAIWAARNIKYFPLGLQEALQKDDRLAQARGYKASCFKCSVKLILIKNNIPFDIRKVVKKDTMIIHVSYQLP